MSYWEDRQRQLNKALDKDEAKLKKRLNKIYEKEAARLDKEIAQYFARYGENNVIEYRKLMEGLSDADKVLLIEKMNEFAAKYPEYSHLMPVRESIYKLDRLQGLQYSLRMQQLTIGAEENKLIKEHLEKAAERSITAASEVMGFGTSFYTMNPNIIKNFVDVPWGNGMKFSDRLWQNKEKLYNYLSTDLAQGFARGDSYQRLSVALRTRFKNVSRNDAFRLIYTEGTFVQAEASMQPFTEDFEQYKISTVGDNKVCPICSAISKEVFEIKDRVAGENFPPFHPWCRCTFIPVVEDWDEWIDNYVAKHGGDSSTQAEKIVDRLTPEYSIAESSKGNIAAVEATIKTVIANSTPKVQGILKDTIFDIGNVKRCNCSPAKNLIRLSSDATAQQINHEIGHLLEGPLISSEELTRIKKELFKDASPWDVKRVELKDGSSEFYLINEALISRYQGRLYINHITEALDDNGNIVFDKMLEILSEPYALYMKDPGQLKQKSEFFYDLIERIIL